MGIYAGEKPLSIPGLSAYQQAIMGGYAGEKDEFCKALANLPNTVLFAAQSLTDAQKTQARGNIGAAPDGYGLGETIPNGSSDADTITKTCFFFAKNNTPTNDWCFGLCISRGPDKKLQIMWSEQGSGYQFNDGCYAERIMKAGIWGPWEWVNPPMKLGVEYRTTERYLGNPVYCKLVDCGAIVEGKIVDLGLNNPATIISVDAIVNNAPSPAFYTASGLGIYGNSYYVDYYHGTPRTGAIIFHIGSGQPQGYVKVKYTKTTD